MEENYWLFKTRRELIARQVKNEKRDMKILDIGCAGGLLLEKLQTMGFNKLYGIDISKNSVNLCKEKGLKNVFFMDGNKTKFKNSEFDILIASDVLEHIKEDLATLKEWNRILKPRGKLIVYTPAFEFLWTEHDEINQHFRRYSKATLTNVLKQAGFSIERESYWNFISFFPASIFSLFEKVLPINKKKKKDHLFGSSLIVNTFVTGLIRVENLLLSFLDFPVGVSVFAICKKG